MADVVGTLKRIRMAFLFVAIEPPSSCRAGTLSSHGGTEPMMVACWMVGKVMPLTNQTDSETGIHQSHAQ